MVVGLWDVSLVVEEKIGGGIGHEGGDGKVWTAELGGEWVRTVLIRTAFMMIYLDVERSVLF